MFKRGGVKGVEFVGREEGARSHKWMGAYCTHEY